MKSLVNYALQHAEIEPARLIGAIERLDPDIQERFVELTLGLVDEDAICNSIPKKSNLYNDREARFVCYNYLNDEVRYEYDDTTVRYFDTEADSIEFEKTGRSNGKGSSEKSGENIYPGVYTRLRSGSTNLSTWEGYAVRK